MCSCQLDQFHGVDVCCQAWTLCEAFRKWNCFGDDVIADFHWFIVQEHVEKSLQAFLWLLDSQNLRDDDRVPLLEVN